MSKSDAHENEYLLYAFHGTPPSWSMAADFYLSLHTADPGEGGSQTTNEASYSGYARVAVPRDSGGWTVTGGIASNAAEVQFPLASSGPQVITHVGIGIALSGAGGLLWRCALGSPVTVGPGGRVTIAAGALTVTES